MRASDAKLSAIKTAHDAIETIDAIERNPRNYIGGFRRWRLGVDVELTAAASAKISAIEKKLFRMADG